MACSCPAGIIGAQGGAFRVWQVWHGLCQMVAGGGLPIVARSVPCTGGGVSPPFSPPPPCYPDKPPCPWKTSPLVLILARFMSPPPPRALWQDRRVGVGIPSPAMNTPSDKATPLLTTFHPHPVNATLLSCAQQPGSETLRKINNVIFDKTPPFFWLYGGDTEGATNSPSQRTVSYLI